MKVLVIGGGGREHALVWKIVQSPLLKKIFCAPGNAGIEKLATCVGITAADIDSLLAFARDEKIDLTVVGPEDPLAGGIVDRFESEGLRIFGASKKAARIESSKSFAKAIMEKYGVPTAKGETFTRYAQAQTYVKKVGVPVVVKADGLAAGKGVIVCTTEKMAMDALKQIMVDRDFGEAGDHVVVEECLVGEEASFLAFTDGKTVLPLPSSQDHKPVYDDDKGLNTGGMGAYSPAPVVDQYLHRRIMDEVMIPMVRGMAAEGCPYKGVLYAGLMIDGDRIKVLEFNGRFGDPEAQPLLVRLANDIIPIMEAVIDERLDTCELDIDPRASVCVVMAAGGYPKSYKKGHEIKGIDAANRMRGRGGLSRRHPEPRKESSHTRRPGTGCHRPGRHGRIGHQEGISGCGPRSNGAKSIFGRISERRPWCECRRCHGLASSWAVIQTLRSWKAPWESSRNSAFPSK